MRLSGKVVVITGATGIAEAGALHFASAGAKVFVVSIDGRECENLARRVEAAGGVADWVAADLTIESEAEASFLSAARRFDRIDGLYAVVGASGRQLGDGPTDSIPLEGWRRTIGINTEPHFLAAREALQVMRNQDPKDGSRGSIVLVGSVLANHPSPQLFATHAYAAAKGAIVSLTRTMASYYAPELIRVNAIAPGLVKTPMSERAASDQQIVSYTERKQPLAGGMLAPEDVAHAALFFLSPESRRITGQVLEVDGGWSVTETWV